MHTHLLFELTIILYIYGLHRRRALIDAICEKSPSTWYTLIGETIVKEADNKKDIEDAFNDESYAACSKGSKLIWK